MRTLEEIRAELKILKPIIRERFQVDTIGIFGSYSRGEQNEKSDIDLVVTLVEPNSFDLLDLIALKRYLRRKLKSKVDVGLKRSLNEEIRERVLRETVYV